MYKQLAIKPAIMFFLIGFIMAKCVYAQQQFIDIQNDIRYNEKTNLPRAIYNVNSRQYSGTPQEIARQYLLENKTLLGLKDNLDDMRIAEVKESPAGHHVGLIQNYEGIPVFRSEMVVSINHQNRISMIVSGYKPNISVNTTPRINKDQSLVLAKQAIGVVNDKEVHPSKSELMVYEDSLSTYYLVWKFVIFPLELGGEWLVIIDAHNGNVLEKFNVVFNYVNGKGRVFDPDPGTYLRDATLTDQNDADYAALQPAYKDNVVLNDLNNAVGGFYYVRGRYAWSMDGIPPSDPVTKVNHQDSLRFKRNQNGFEEVNIYYFIDKQRRYVGGLGFVPTWDFLSNNSQTIAFDARASTNVKASYSPSLEYMWFGVPSSSVDAGEDQCVILHEYGHAFHDALMFGGTDEASDESDTRGVSEGLADYLAISYRRTTQAVPFRPNYRSNWFLPSGGEDILPVASAQYPTHWSPTDPYAKMKVWASTLMDIEYNTATDPSAGTRLGRDITTTLLLTSLNYLTSSNNVIDNVNAILQADRDIYNGSHLPTLAPVFYNRGFFYSNVVSGTISSNTTWSGSKYVTGNVTINSGVTLTISPNTFVFFANGTSLTVNGVINAVGTQQNPIIFTSATGTTPGSWQYVRVTNGNSIFKYCTFEYGTIGLHLYNADSGDPVDIENCTFKNNSYYGLDILGSNALVKSCYIYNNTYEGIYCTYGSDIDLVGNQIYNNGSLGINSYYYNELELFGNVIENNSSHGIQAAYEDNVSIGAVYSWWGYNTIRENGGNEINTVQYEPNLLEISGASIHDDDYPPYYEIYNYPGNSTIEAQSVYWDEDCYQCTDNVTLMATIYCELPEEWDGQTRTSGSPLGKKAASLQAGEIEWYWDPNISDAEKIKIGKDIISSNPESSEGKEALRRIYSIIRKDYRNNNLGERDKFFDYLKSIQTKYPDSETGKLAFKYMIVWKILERDNASVVQLSNKALEQFNGQDKKLVLVGLALTYINTGEVTEARNILQTLRSKYDDDEKLAASLEFEIANVEQMIANGQYKPEGNARYTKIGTGVPQAIELIQNYPNPFNPSTTISYALPVQSDVQLIIYDIMGREVKTLVSSRQEAGYKEVVWDGRNNFNEQAASGIYICRLKATSLENLNVFEKSIKLVLIK